MNIGLLSPEQRKLLFTLLNKEESITSYFDMETAMQVLLSYLSRQISGKKKILLHTEDPAIISSLKVYFSHSGWSELVFDFFEDVFSVEDLVKLRTAEKNLPSLDKIIDLKNLQRDIAGMENSLELKYADLEEEILPGQSLKKVIEERVNGDSKNEDEIRDQRLELILANITPSDFEKALSLIRQLASISKREFLVYDKLGLFGKANEIDAKVLPIIKSFIDEGCRILIQFYDIKNKMLDAQLERIKDIQKEALDILDKAYQKMSINDLNQSLGLKQKKGLLTFGKQRQKDGRNGELYATLLQDLANLFSKVPNHIGKWDDDLESTISTDILLAKTSEKIHEKIEYLKKASTKEFEKINTINATDPRIIQASESMKNWIDNINAAKVFKDEIYKKPLSISMQMVLIREILTELETIQILSDVAPQYKKWVKLRSECGEVTSLLLDAIIRYSPQTWENILVSHFKKVAIDKVTSLTFPKWDEIEALKEKFRFFQKLEPLQLLYKLHEDRQKAILDLKKEDKKLYNSLFKKNHPEGITKHKLMSGHPQILTGLFPIHIGPAIDESHYDHIIHIGCPSCDKGHLLRPYKGEQENEGAYLYLHQYKYQEKMDQLPNSDKLRAAKILAKELLSIASDVMIYQMKTANVISLLKGNDSLMLENLLLHYGAKPMAMDEPYEKIIESILLVERPQFLILKDGLLNDDYHEYAVWQSCIIDHYQSIGYQIINVNTFDQLQDNALVYDNMLMKLGLKHLSKPILTQEINKGEIVNQKYQKEEERQKT